MASPENLQPLAKACPTTPVRPQLDDQRRHGMRFPVPNTVQAQLELQRSTPGPAVGRVLDRVSFEGPGWVPPADVPGVFGEVGRVLKASEVSIFTLLSTSLQADSW